MNIQVGAGGVRLPGFLNVDVRKVEGVDIIGDASDLSQIKDGTVDTLFGNALFEHLFIAHQLAALREWKRILSPAGLMIVIGIPDFAAIAELYLKGAKGIFGGRFDLHNVYRYTHGEPEHATQPVWPVFRATNGSAPDGWIPQLHKGLFDASYLRDLLTECDLGGVIFNYAYPGEEPAICLGFIAGQGRHAGTSVQGILRDLERIPDVCRFVDRNTVSISDTSKPKDSMLDHVKNLESRRPRSLSEKIGSRLSKAIGRADSSK